MKDALLGETFLKPRQNSFRGRSRQLSFLFVCFDVFPNLKMCGTVKARKKTQVIIKTYSAILGETLKFSITLCNNNTLYYPQISNTSLVG